MCPDIQDLEKAQGNNIGNSSMLPNHAVSNVNTALKKTTQHANKTSSSSYNAIPPNQKSSG